MPRPILTPSILASYETWLRDIDRESRAFLRKLQALPSQFEVSDPNKAYTEVQQAQEAVLRIVRELDGFIRACQGQRSATARMPHQRGYSSAQAGRAANLTGFIRQASKLKRKFEGLYAQLGNSLDTLAKAKRSTGNMIRLSLDLIESGEDFLKIVEQPVGTPNVPGTPDALQPSDVFSSLATMILLFCTMIIEKKKKRDREKNL